MFCYIADPLDQAWANYGSGATCGPLGFLFQPAELGKIMFILGNVFILPAIFHVSY